MLSVPPTMKMDRARRLFFRCFASALRQPKRNCDERSMAGRVSGDPERKGDDACDVGARGCETQPKMLHHERGVQPGGA